MFPLLLLLLIQTLLSNACPFGDIPAQMSQVHSVPPPPPLTSNKHSVSVIPEFYGLLYV